MMSFEVGEALRLKLEISEMKPHAVATLAHQHLARGAAKLTTAMRRKLVWLQRNVAPSKTPLETAHYRRRHRFGDVSRLARHGCWCGWRYVLSAPNVTTTFSASGFCAVAKASVMRRSGN